VKAVGVTLLVVLGAFVAIGSVLALAAFSRYCDQVAKLQGRTEERHRHQGSDENVKNAFEREQYWNLLLGKHRLPGDPPVNELGDRLAMGFRVLLVSSVVLVASLAVIFSG
jgi:hypothetical protein